MNDGATSVPALPAGRGNGHDAALLAAARKLVEGTTLSQAKICADLGIRPNVLTEWKYREGWVRPEGAPKPPVLSGVVAGRRSADAEVNFERRRALIDKLYQLCARQAVQIERRLKQKEPDEKDARVLGTLARTLDTLMALDRDNGPKADTPEPIDRDAANADLARRITRWAEGREEPE